MKPQNSNGKASEDLLHNLTHNLPRFGEVFFRLVETQIAAFYGQHKEVVMTEFYNSRVILPFNELNSENATLTIGSLFQKQSPIEMKNFIFTCLETLSEQNVDVTDALNAVDSIQIEREFDVAVTVTFDLMIKVTAPDEETAETLVQGFEAADLVSSSSYGLDGVEDIDVQSADVVIDGVEEA
jgi:hypothetical protein